MSPKSIRDAGRRIRTSQRYHYDSLNRLTTLDTLSALNALLQRFDYTLHPTGRRTQIEELNGRTTAYTYDNLYRLTAESITDTANGNYSAEYTYDNVGNRVYETIDGVSTAYTYDANDRLTQTGGKTFVYDSNGNTLSETLDGITTSYTYNSQNQLVETLKDGITTTYRYNAEGIRTGQGNGTTETTYVVDQNRDYAQVLLEANTAGSNTESVLYTYGDDLISQNRNSSTSYYHYDGLGSTRALSDASGSLTDTYAYEAFGTLLNQTGETENNYLFTGEQYDPNLNQYYLRARYYNQSVGRFTQQDTWMGNNHDPVTLHKYLYANVDPGNMVDPTGKFSMGSMMMTLNVQGILSTLSMASTAYDLFQVATGEQEFSAKQLGLSILLSRMPGSSLAKKMAAKYKAKTGKSLKIPCLNNSFLAGTLVHTMQGLIAIEDVQIGDYVLSFNERSGMSEYQEVIHLIRRESDYELVNIEVEGDESFVATLEHPFYVDNRWKAAGELSSLDFLTLIDGYSSIVGLTNLTRKTPVFNITVANAHTYYIGEIGALVHNADANCVISVGNMGEFFETAFGLAIKKMSRKTGKVVPGQGQSLYTATKNAGSLRKGDYFYLDGLHKDHLEVFDKTGRFLRVLNLDGSENAAKTAAAVGRTIKDLL